MVLNECQGCGTRFAHDLLRCPHCGAEWTPVGPTPAEPVVSPKSDAPEADGSGETDQVSV